MLINNNQQKIKITLEYNGNSFTISTYKYKPISFLEEKVYRHFYPIRNKICLFYMNKNLNNFEEKPIGFFFRSQHAATIQIKDVFAIQNKSYIKQRKNSFDTNITMNNSVNHSSIHNNSSLNILPYIHKPKKVKNIFQEISIDMLCFSCHTENVRFYCRNCNKFICLSCASDKPHSEHKVFQIKNDYQENISSYKEKIITELTQTKNLISNISFLNNKKVDIEKWEKNLSCSIDNISNVSNKLQSSVPSTNFEDRNSFGKEYEKAKSKLNSIQIDKYKDPFELFEIINKSEKTINNIFHDSIAYNKKEIMKRRIQNIYDEVSAEIDLILKKMKKN